MSKTLLPTTSQFRVHEGTEGRLQRGRGGLANAPIVGKCPHNTFFYLITVFRAKKLWGESDWSGYKNIQAGSKEIFSTSLTWLLRELKFPLSLVNLPLPPLPRPMFWTKPGLRTALIENKSAQQDSNLDSPLAWHTSHTILPELPQFTPCLYCSVYTWNVKGWRTAGTGVRSGTKR